MEEERARLRVSDEERHRVAERLREAAGDGRLTLAELDERLGAAYAARTYAELAPLTRDLPATGARPPLPVAPAAAAVGERTWAAAVLSGLDRRGPWVVPPRLTVVACLGGAEIDLREARFTAPVTLLRVHAVMGGVKVVVDPATHVIVEGHGLMGGYAGRRGSCTPRWARARRWCGCAASRSGAGCTSSASTAAATVRPCWDPGLRKRLHDPGLRLG